HPLFTGMMYNVAGNRLDGGDFDGAAELLERALPLVEQNFGPKTLEVAQFSETLGRARIEQRRIKEARTLIEQAIEIREARHADGELGDSYRSLAVVFRFSSDLAKALELSQKALAADRAKFGDEHEKVADDYRGIAEALLDLGRVGEARAAIEKAD